MAVRHSSGMTGEKTRPTTKPSRTDQARQVAEEYANDQREIKAAPPDQRAETERAERPCTTQGAPLMRLPLAGRDVPADRRQRMGHAYLAIFFVSSRLRTVALATEFGSGFIRRFSGRVRV